MSTSLELAIAKAEEAAKNIAAKPPVIPEVLNDFASQIQKHEKDFKPDAWKDYTTEELYWWVHLLLKRAKGDKDIYDAGNYLGMYKEALKAYNPGTDPEIHPNVVALTSQLKSLG